MVYFRAFSINDVGAGYGDLNTKVTLPIDRVPVVVNLNKLVSPSISRACGDIELIPSLSGDQAINISLSVDHINITSGGGACTEITCDNGKSVTTLYLCDMVYGDGFIPESVSTTINFGDVIKWDHCIDGSGGAKAELVLTEVSTSSSGISPVIGDDINSVVGFPTA